MKIGDVMISVNGPFSSDLASGCERYTHAILVSADPFVMVSEGGDMMWRHLKTADFVALCEASSHARRKAFARWRRETKLDRR